MCGILAYFNRNGIQQEQISQSLSALKKIKHRGPDGEGVVLINSKTGEFRNLITDETPEGNFPNAITINEISEFKFDLLFGHRRLSIIDLSVNGHQPMSDEIGNWIVFNGEVYNYIELREELKKENCKFKTDTDTEVILAAYRTWGPTCVKKFNGMFSIVLFDKKKHELFVANDRFGVKPLYIFNTASELVLSSEIKEIKAYQNKLTYNENAFSNFVRHAYLDFDNSTFFNEVKRFPNSHYSEISLDKELQLRSSCYYELTTRRSVSDNYKVEEFRELLNDSVRLRLRSDVEVGFASSGGLDSSSILYAGYHLIKNTQPKPNLTTFSAIFPGMEGDESEFIKIVENDLAIKSNYTNPLEQFDISDFERLISHQEFPVQSTSYYAEWCVSRLVQNHHVKVLLVGQGGDEILAGYHHYFYRYCRQLILEGHILKYLSLIKKYSELKGLELNALHKRVIGEVKLAIRFRLGLTRFSNKLNEKWNKADKLIELLKLDLQEYTLPTYLRSGDRSAMAFSVEARHPFLDYRLVDYCFSLSDEAKINEGWQKWILRKAVPEMPESIGYRKDKKGFTTPQKEWVDNYKSQFNEYLDYLPDPYKNMSGDLFFKYSLGAWIKLNNQD